MLPYWLLIAETAIRAIVRDGKAVLHAPRESWQPGVGPADASRTGRLARGRGVGTDDLLGLQACGRVLPSVTRMSGWALPGSLP